MQKSEEERVERKSEEKVTSISGRIDDGGTHVGTTLAPSSPLSSSEFKLVVLVGEVVKVEVENMGGRPVRDKLSR